MIGFIDLSDVGHGFDRGFKIRVEAGPHGCIDGRTQSRGFIKMGLGGGQSENIGC